MIGSALLAASILFLSGADAGPQSANIVTADGKGTTRTLVKGISRYDEIAAGPGHTFYVGSGDGVVQYDGTSGRKIRVMLSSSGGAWSLTSDLTGNLVVSQTSTIDGGIVTAFSARAAQKPIVITSGLHNPRNVAVDGSGTIYAVNEGRSVQSVAVYRRNVTTPAYVITVGMNYPQCMIVASDGTLYVGQSSNTVTVFEPGSTVPRMINVTGTPEQLAVSPQGVLALEFDSGGYNRINFYALGSGTPMAQVSPPKDHKFSAIGFDSSGTFYAALEMSWGEDRPAMILRYASLSAPGVKIADAQGTVKFIVVPW